MDNNCCNKKTKRSSDDKKLIINRLNRISGQINGITKMVENDAYCNDVLIQLSAVKNSVRYCRNRIIAECPIISINRHVQKRMCFMTNQHREYSVSIHSCFAKISYLSKQFSFVTSRGVSNRENRRVDRIIFDEFFY